MTYSNSSEEAYVHNEATPSSEKRDNRDEMALVLVFKGLKVSDSVSSGSLQNLATKDVATEAIQNSLLSAKALGQEQVNTLIEKGMIIPEDKDKPEVPIHAILNKSKAKTFASLYELAKNPKIKDNKTVIKAG